MASDNIIRIPAGMSNEDAKEYFKAKIEEIDDKWFDESPNTTREKYEKAREEYYNTPYKAEEIVRCKDCKHCEKRYEETDKQTLYMCEDEHCNDGTVGCEMVVEPNFFCAYGEKDDTK